ncbi:MAG: hypothetical protein Q8J78_08790 [Moraxellaceae bacterium]|nr:hypothetical protein [Moraxellaceae bacterium]
MRMVSLLITLLIVAWLVYTQLGGDKAPEQTATYREAEQKAEDASALLEAQTREQVERMERLQQQGREDPAP